jgi:hypothetical protein
MTPASPGVGPTITDKPAGGQETAMNYSTDNLKDKIRQFHPEVDQKGMNLKVTWDEAGKRFALTLSQAGQEVGAYLDQQDADDCMAGKKCLNLAVQVTQLIAELTDLVTPRKPG